MSTMTPSEIQKRGDICICMDDSPYYTVETNIIKQIHFSEINLLKYVNK